MSSSNSGASGLAGRYATALYDLAEAEKRLDAIVADLDTLAGMIAESEDLRRLLRSPVISGDDQQKAIVALCEKVELDELTRRSMITQSKSGTRLFVDHAGFM